MLFDSIHPKGQRIEIEQRCNLWESHVSDTLSSQNRESNGNEIVCLVNHQRMDSDQAKIVDASVLC